ncbi:DNA polymerase Y family protein (plasmid) [Dyadobacter chenhuakuii]|uniref:DNA polymerase Y family protein n=1 Tax=Dyadobacter chenhuakuii TaxID=2909339 RepID=A0ABY5EBC5_9BACT|nr:DNA polymerase Y family protein [Dyadobacter chenhuakuii]
MARFVSIWFPDLTTDRLVLKRPELAGTPFVLAAPSRGRVVVKAASPQARGCGIVEGMVVADARAVLPSLEVIEDDSELAGKLLAALAKWALRYTPLAGVDLDDGLILDATGCTHLWGGEMAYLKDIVARLKGSGYDARAAMADTIAAAWAVCRYGKSERIVAPGAQLDALLALPPTALRLEQITLEKMHKLGFYQIKSFVYIAPSVLKRRFGQALLDRLGQALGHVHEAFEPIQPPEPFTERLPCLEPIRTAPGIEIAMQKLLEMLCSRLVKEGQGVRKAVLKCYRIDGEMRQVEIGTSFASCSAGHLFKLFELKIPTIEPALGIELFVLEAPIVEPLGEQQDQLFNIGAANKWVEIAELLDRLVARAGPDISHRYLPAQHYWPERCTVEAASLKEQPQTTWRIDRPRPVHLLPEPQRVEVSAPVPDYPPMLFRYQGEVHKIKRADGPERIEQEWWIQQGLHRDYYTVEDEAGARFWIFRLGHYQDDNKPEWFIHGYFA